MENLYIWVILFYLLLLVIGVFSSKQGRIIIKIFLVIATLGATLAILFGKINGDLEFDHETSEFLLGRMAVAIPQPKTYELFGVELTKLDTANLKKNYSKKVPVICGESSFLTNSEGYEYRGSNVIDGDIGTSWQDGLENRDATGENLIFLFEACEIDYILIRNGNAKSNQSYYDNCRVKVLKITDDRGHMTTIELKDVNEWQQIKLSGCPNVAQLVFEIVSEYAGNKYDDTCISEVEFYGK